MLLSRKVSEFILELVQAIGHGFQNRRIIAQIFGEQDGAQHILRLANLFAGSESIGASDGGGHGLHLQFLVLNVGNELIESSYDCRKCGEICN